MIKFYFVWILIIIWFIISNVSFVIISWSLITSTSRASWSSKSAPIKVCLSLKSLIDSLLRKCFRSFVRVFRNSIILKIQFISLNWHIYLLFFITSFCFFLILNKSSRKLIFEFFIFRFLKIRVIHCFTGQHLS